MTWGMIGMGSMVCFMLLFVSLLLLRMVFAYKNKIDPICALYKSPAFFAYAIEVNYRRNLTIEDNII